MTRSRLLADLAALVGISGLLAGAHLGLRDELPWVAVEPVDLGSCSLQEEGAEGAEAPSRPAMPTISAGEAIALVGRGGVTFVDARSSERFADGHVPGALCLPAGDAASLLATQSLPVAPSDLVITYCDGQGPGEAEALGLLLRERLGCQEIRVLGGGWEQWLAAGGPTDGGPDRG